jgi:hypothetical protein
MTVETVDLTRTLGFLDSQPDLGGSIQFIGTTGLGPSTGAHATENLDLQISFATVRESGRMQAPAGYTELFPFLTASTQAFYGYYKFLAGGETLGFPFQGTDSSGVAIETADYTVQSLIYRGVDLTKPLETNVESAASTNIIHWGRGARTGVNPTGDTTTVDNCLNVWVFMHSAATRTIGVNGIWTAELVERVVRSNSIGPEIRIAEKPIYKAGAVGGHHLAAGSSFTNGCMVQFCLRPATP